MYHDSMAQALRYFLFLLISAVSLGAETASEEDDIRVLKTARIQPDGPGAIRYFRLRSTDNNEIPALIAQLGDETYTVRERAVEELIARGVPAIGKLKAATSHPDVEIARRAARCRRRPGRGCERLSRVPGGS